MAKSFPLIGITTYELTVDRNPPIQVAGIMVDYKDAVIEAGGIPVLIPQNLEAPQLKVLMDKLDGLLIPGGGDINPKRYRVEEPHAELFGVSDLRDEIEIHLACDAVQRQMPLLAICRGHQVLNVALGGTLWQDIGTQQEHALKHDYFRMGIARDYLAHEIDVEPESKLANLLGETRIEVNSFHHQAIRDLAPGLKVSARATDGLIEAAEIPEHPFAVSVQWHPENITGVVPQMKGLFEGLINAI